MDGRTGALMVACLLAGCGQRGTTIITTKSSPNGPAEIGGYRDSEERSAAAAAVSDFIGKAKVGTAMADSLTVDFKKIIGEPLTPAERELGYSDTAATEWLKIVGPRLQSFKVVGIGDAPWLFELEAGTIRVVKSDSKWHVDWFHAGAPWAGSVLIKDDAPKRFAVAAFLDPIFTNNWELSEAALTDDSKKVLAPALGADSRGYNRGTLRSKFRNLLNGATGYSVSVNGDKAVVTLTGAGERKLTLSLSELRPGVWLVSGID